MLTGLGSLFIPQPWLALIPGLVFAVLYRLSGRGLVGLAALAWGLYAAYEYAILRRWLCSGECNIRVDLLLAYPVLVLMSAAAAIVAIRSILGRRENQDERS
jgi:hypothetical protein